MKRKKHSLLIQIIGWAGTVLLIVAYALNSFGLIESQSLLYPTLNILAGAFLGFRVFADRNYSNLILEFFWIGVAIISLIRYFL
jgi:hypothetical protein